MRVTLAYLESRVARRIFLLFIACALLPLGALAALVLIGGTGELKAKALRDLQIESKNRGMAILERLGFLDAEIQTLSSRNLLDGEQRAPAGAESRFDGMAILEETGGRRMIFGSCADLPAQSG